MRTLEKKQPKILLTGGGTGGSVSPVLAICDIIKQSESSIRKSDFIWIGTTFGPERVMVEQGGISYRSIVSGKYRRYFSWKNFTDPLKIIFAIFQSIVIILKEKPNLIISAGSFVSVPVVIAGWLLKVPILIHQLDYRPGLANIIMAKFASVVTVTFEKSLLDYGKKAKHIGAFMRSDLTINKVSKKFVQEKLGLRSSKPVVLVVGGGTGSLAINNIVIKSLPELSRFCQIIHITGIGKQSKQIFKLEEQYREYKSFEFLNTDGLIKVFTIAEVVISRAGIGMFIELSQLKKASIIIPIPNSHQEENANILKETNSAIILSQKDIDNKDFTTCIKKLITNKELRDGYQERIYKAIKKGKKEEMEIIINNLLRL